MRHRDAIELIIIFIAFLLLFIAGHLFSNYSRACRPLTLVPPDIEQLFSNRVFRGEAVLDVRLEERLSGITTAPVWANLGRSQEFILARPTASLGLSEFTLAGGDVPTATSG